MVEFLTGRLIAHEILEKPVLIFFLFIHVIKGVEV